MYDLAGLVSHRKQNEKFIHDNNNLKCTRAKQRGWILIHRR